MARVQRVIRAVCTALAVALLLVPFNLPAAEPTSADLRLLVDVSGSMNQTDPQNLRREGLGLLGKMLPAGTHVGLWRFASKVSEIVPASRVDDPWRASAEQALQQLRSNGQLTDIGAALSRAARSPKQASQAHILLLTDGKVDIGNKPERNQRERDSIITELLPNLVARDFVIHTIALSADADAELLRLLAQESGGEHRVVTNRDELVSVFVDILDQAVPPQRLPISGDGFVVDDSVDELTVLIYHTDSAAARPHLLTPDLQTISAEHHEQTVRWLSRPRYDLATIPAPQSGLWQLKGSTDDTRVTILTDLTLHVQPLAASVLPSEPLTLKFVLRERNQVITDPELLQGLSAHLSMSARNREGEFAEPLSQEASLVPDGRSGHFLLRTHAPSEPGRYQLHLRVNGATFAREYQRSFAVGPAFTAQLVKRLQHTSEGQKTTYSLEVTPAATLDPAHTEIVAHIKNSAGGNSIKPLKPMANGVWQTTITPTQRGRYVVEPRAQGRDFKDRPLSQSLDAHYFTYPAEGDPEPPVTDPAIAELEQALAQERAALARERGEPELEASEPETPAASKPESETEPAAEPDTNAEAMAESKTPSEPDAEGMRWWLIALVVLANGALLGGAYWLYRRFSGSSMEADVSDAEAQLTAQANTEAAEPEQPAEAFEDVFADMDETPAAPESEPADTDMDTEEVIQLDDDDSELALQSSPEAQATEPEAEPSDDERMAELDDWAATEVPETGEEPSSPAAEDIDLSVVEDDPDADLSEPEEQAAPTGADPMAEPAETDVPEPPDEPPELDDSQDSEDDQAATDPDKNRS
jgi:uncharacterized protein (TIGR03503 family)